MSADPIFAEPNALTSKLYQTLKRHPKRIVFADGEDLRVIRVAERMVSMEIGVPILLGNIENIRKIAEEHDISMTFVCVVDPHKTSELDLFSTRLKKVARFQGREIMYLDLGQEKFDQVVKLLADVAEVEERPPVRGNFMYMVLNPVNNAGPACSNNHVVFIVV